MSETLGSALLVLGTDDKKLQSGLKKAKSSVEKMGKSMRDVGKSMSLKLTAPIVGLGTAILTAAANFETGMNQVQALTGATGEEFKALNDQAKELGATTQFSAGQAADAMGFLAQAGLKTEQILGTMPATLDLAAASGMGLAETADTMTNIMSGFGLKADDSARASDVLTAAFTNSNTNLAELGEAMSFAGPVLSGFGITFEETAAAVGLLGNAGIKASRAGTALSGALVRLATPAKEQAELMKKLGINVFGTDGKMLSLVEIVEQLETSGADTSEIMKLFGQRAGPAMAALLKQGSKALGDMTEKLENSGGKAKEIAEVQMKGLSGAMKSFKSALEAVAIAIAETGLIKWATDIATAVAGWLREIAKANPEILKWGVIIAGVIAVAGPLLLLLGTFVPVITGIITVIGLILSPIGLLVAGIVGIGVAAWVFRDDIVDAFNAVKKFAIDWWNELKKKVFGAFIATIDGIIDAWNFMVDLVADTPQNQEAIASSTDDGSGFSDDAFKDTGTDRDQDSSIVPRPQINVTIEGGDEGLFSGRQVRQLVEQINVEQSDDSTGVSIQVL